MKMFVTRKTIIKEFAKEIAELQRKADIWFYEKNNQDHSSWLLDQVLELSDFASRLGINREVYQEAHKIYDFRNSGKTGYTLRDGKIVQPDDVGRCVKENIKCQYANDSACRTISDCKYCARRS